MIRKTGMYSILICFINSCKKIDKSKLTYKEDKEVLHLICSMFKKAKESQGNITISSY